MEYCPGGDLHSLRQKQPGKYFTEHAARNRISSLRCVCSTSKAGSIPKRQNTTRGKPKEFRILAVQPASASEPTCGVQPRPAYNPHVLFPTDSRVKTQKKKRNQNPKPKTESTIKSPPLPDAHSWRPS
ncbi:hypothetical protein Tco_1058500 [Tanacetum coccineum]|uniref:Uncharacterized protein n=1 Tax=Tanacetum coccineum TaxID=301880 RepID=A0ABQ5HAG4_9ASTR